MNVWNPVRQMDVSHRLAALRASQDLLSALVDGLPEPATPRQVRFKIALRERQAVVERSWPGLPPLIQHLDSAQAKALTDAGLQGWR